MTAPMTTTKPTISSIDRLRSRAARRGRRPDRNACRRAGDGRFTDADGRAIRPAQSCSVAMASATARMRAPIGMSQPRVPSGPPLPSHHSRLWRISHDTDASVGVPSSNCSVRACEPSSTPFRIANRRLARQHRLRQRELADVVHQRGAFDVGAALAGQVQRLRHDTSETGDAARVAEHGRRRLERPLELLVRRRGRR